jgi:hypothetical protein
MAVSGADKAFRDRQAMIGEFSPIPQGYAFLCRPWEKYAFKAPFWGLLTWFCGALHQSGPIQANPRRARRPCTGPPLPD